MPRSKTACAPRVRTPSPVIQSTRGCSGCCSAARCSAGSANGSCFPPRVGSSSRSRSGPGAAPPGDVPGHLSCVPARVRGSYRAGARWAGAVILRRSATLGSSRSAAAGRSPMSTTTCSPCGRRVRGARPAPLRAEPPDDRGRVARSSTPAPGRVARSRMTQARAAGGHAMAAARDLRGAARHAAYAAGQAAVVAHVAAHELGAAAYAIKAARAAAPARRARRRRATRVPVAARPAPGGDPRARPGRPAAAQRPLLVGVRLLRCAAKSRRGRACGGAARARRRATPVPTRPLARR